MKPTQGESHQAESMKILLREMIELAKNGKGFSDNKLIKLSFMYPHTVRNIRKKLVEMKIIQQDLSQKLPNNEKVYRVYSIKQAEQLERINSELSDSNERRRSLGKYYKKYGIRVNHTFKMRYYPPQKQAPETYPWKLYRKKMCPICSKKGLRDFKHGDEFSTIDKRCHYCKYTFQYGQNWEGVMYVRKN